MKNKYHAPLINIFCLFIFIFQIAHSKAQEPKQLNASEIKQAIKKLNVLGNVLYFAAHPDDENTSLIAYLSNGMLLDVAYLSMTRGDGGQNLLGTEIREQLGIIRTQELLQARRQDGSQQFFTRANDFGYSKSAKETLEIWDHDKVLADAIWVIRKFRPDAIITRFPPDSRAGHGQHESSTLLALEAFDKSGDQKVYPDQLKYVEPWQPTNVFINSGRWWRESIDEESDSIFTLDVGQYNQLLGQSYTEISGRSRSMHKSQGFGSSGYRGKYLEYLELIKGKIPEKEAFDKIDFTWGRVEQGATYKNLVDNILQNYDIENPVASVSALINLYHELDGLSDDFWREKKQQEVKWLVKNCLGLFLEISADAPAATKGDSININVELVLRSEGDVKVNNLQFSNSSKIVILNKQLENNDRLVQKIEFLIPDEVPITLPYWLVEPGSQGLYKVEEQTMIGMPETPPAIMGKFNVSIEDESFDFEAPLIYKYTDPTRGEVYEQFIISPPVTVNATEELMIFSNEKKKTLQYTVKSWQDGLSGSLKLDAPKGWKVSPDRHEFSKLDKNDEKSFEFSIVPVIDENIGYLKPKVLVNGVVYERGLEEIDYDHIPKQIHFPETRTKLVKLNIKHYGQQIGYIMGAGDEIPICLTQMGYRVDLLNEQEFKTLDLQKYDAIILGIRALNTNDWISIYKEELLDYAYEGGNLVIQYNTLSRRFDLNDFAPYTLKLSRDRVAQENAKVSFLAPGHEVLNIPNKITKKDFDDWVQERGLYFPNEWGNEFTPILSWQDDGEEDSPKQGGLLVAAYGKGNYIYTGISFFRQLPAGVIGAYRLFANILSIGNHQEEVK